jgi:hypothetical protein
MGYSGFVPHVDNPHAAAHRHREHFVQMIAYQREDCVDLKRRQGVYEQAGSVRHGNAMLLQSGET